MKGLFTALITPFKNDTIDKEALKKLIKRQIDAKVDGLVLLGTTGEASTLTWQEKKEIIQLSSEEACNKLQLIVGVSGCSTQQILTEMKELYTEAVSGFMALSPYYNLPTQEGLYQHFSMLADAAKAPLILYNSYKRTGVEIELDTLHKLAKHPQIKGLKECVRSYEKLAAMLTELPLDVFMGDDLWTFPGALMGASGTISVTSNVFPDTMRALVTNARSGNSQEAKKYHDSLLPFFLGSSHTTNPLPIKAAMHYLGFISKTCRMPLTSLTQEEEKQLRRVVDQMELVCKNSA